ncbi:MAG: hypothetical protein ABL921_25100, partial [Pirellula sp.]
GSQFIEIAMELNETNNNQREIGKMGVQKMIHQFSWSLVVAGTFSFGVAQAQGPAIAYPINNWSYQRHSSTAAEGAMRGQAAVLSAAGQTVYLDSLASINYAEAFKRAIENSVAITQAYYDRREIREEYLKKYGPKPFVGEARRKAIEYYLPKRLSDSEFDASSGRLNWPHVLRQEQFAAIVSQIDKTFAARTFENSGDGSSTHRTLSQLCNAMNGILRENISAVTADQYIASKEFIRSVELEARTPVQVDLQTKPNSVSDEPAVPAKNGDSDTTANGHKLSRLKV